MPFALGIAVLTITALLNKIVKLLELFFSGYAELRHLLLFIAAAMPTFLIYVIPAAFLAATLIAVTRMSSDSEMTALRAGGISLYPVMKPVLIFASAAFAITLFMTLFLYPWGNRTVKEVFYEVAGKSASSLVEENTFYNRFKGVIFYAEGISQADGSLKGILMSRRDEKGEQTLITAERGEFLSRRENTAIAIRLENGEAHKKTGKDGVYHLMSFSSYTLELDLEGNAGNQERVRPPRELYTNELLKRIKETGPSREKEAPSPRLRQKACHPFFGLRVRSHSGPARHAARKAGEVHRDRHSNSDYDPLLHTFQRLRRRGGNRFSQSDSRVLRPVPRDKRHRGVSLPHGA